jgi:ABC-type antimicrobial peptide transport system permease subunit
VVIRDFLKRVSSSKLGVCGLVTFLLCVMVALFAPVLAPYDPMMKHYDAANRLEKLTGERAGQYSIRINDQWRICFEWREGHVYNAGIVDYH